jgi:hypothetical protein
MYKYIVVILVVPHLFVRLLLTVIKWVLEMQFCLYGADAMLAQLFYTELKSRSAHFSKENHEWSLDFHSQ